MKEKYIFDDFMSYKRKDDKYYDLGNWLLKGKESYGGYELGELLDYSGYTKAKREKREETPQEREARLLREKAKLREDKIDKLLGL